MVTSVLEPSSNQLSAIRRFILDAWKLAGPGALGWTGATEETISEIASEQYLEGLLANPNLKFFVTEENGEITGFAANRIQDASTMELAGIMVRQDLLDKGIGTLLISKCIDHATNSGFAKMQVKTETSNQRAIQFYVKKGFVQVGEAVETVDDSKVKVAVLELALSQSKNPSRS